jgi:V8-like Glu-specific endopeptidase
MTGRLRAGVLMSVLVCGVAGVAGCGSSATTSARGWSAARMRGAHAQIRPGTSHTAKPTTGNARVGALFSHDVQGDHFCTGSVVDSKAGNLVITAAHCIHDGKGGGYRSDLVFVPAYREGTAPYGQWRVKSMLVDPHWADSSDPDYDVGFLVLQPLNGQTIAQVLGSNPLGTDLGFGLTVKITGYPASGDTPISCVNRTTQQSPTQMRIACTNYTGGTSGSPWLSRFDPGTRRGTLIGVIGGYQQGGDTADVSYSVYFGPAVRSLYDQAVLQGG